MMSKYIRLFGTVAMLILAPLAGHSYLIPLLALMLAMVLEYEFSISKYRFNDRKSLVWYEVFLMKRYGADRIYISVSIQDNVRTWNCRVHNISASASTFDKLVEQLDKNLEIYDKVKCSTRTQDVTI